MGYKKNNNNNNANLSEFVLVARFKVEFRSTAVSIRPVAEHVTFHHSLTLQHRTHTHADISRILHTGRVSFTTQLFQAFA